MEKVIYITIGGAVVLTALAWLIVRIIRRLRCTVNDYDENDHWLASEFRRCNVEVFGKKGSGKDLIFAHVIYLRGEKHYANMPYNTDTEVRRVGDLTLGANKFKNVLAGNFYKMPPQFEEQCDFYISDGGIFLPCQYNKELNDAYPSMPMFFALSRQLYNMNIHVNVQAPTRIWDKLREQADSYIKVRRSRDKGEYMAVDCVCYDNYTLAVNGTLPEDNRTSSVAEYRRFRVYKSELEYDTRFFKDVFLESADGENVPFKAYLRALDGVMSDIKKKKESEKSEIKAADKI